VRRLLAPSLRIAVLTVGQGGLLALAVLLAGVVAWVLGWRLLWEGVLGNDTAFHLHLARWVETTFPGIGWWYPWDASGMSYRQGYPTAGFWLAVLTERWQHLQLTQVFQLIEWLVNPLVAVGINAFCALRLRRPAVGLGAIVLYLISPMPWTNLVDWGLWSSQLGIVFLMPALFALDVFASRWREDDLGWSLRLSAIAFCGLTCLIGLLSPALVAAPVVVAFCYLLAAGRAGWKRHARWLPAALALTCGALALSLFWALPMHDYLAAVGARRPPLVFNGSMIPLPAVDRLLQIRPPRQDQPLDRTSLAPVVWLLAIPGLLGAFFERRMRALGGAALVALGSMTLVGLSWLAYQMPVGGEAVSYRAFEVLLQCLAPILAAYALLGLLPDLTFWAARRLRLAAVAWALLLPLLFAGGLGEAWGVRNVPALLHPHEARPYYGPFPLDFTFDDPWQQVRYCSQDRTYGGWRSPPACPAHPGAQAQLGDIRRWRPWQVGCFMLDCARAISQERADRAAYSRPLQKTVLDANSGAFLMDFHGLTGGSQAYTYNFQLPPSPELDSDMLDHMLAGGDARAKANWAWSVGADSVMLADSQAAARETYRRMGWSEPAPPSGPKRPDLLLNPDPSGVASSWQDPSLALVVGVDQGQNQSHPYNGIYIDAMGGMLSPRDAWLVHGRSPYIDDYSAEELRSNQLLLLYGYRYHDRERAWRLLSDYVQAGGSLYLENGWQYVDPDWAIGVTPSFWPVQDLGWSRIDPGAPVRVGGRPDPAFGRLAYEGSGWGASSTTSLRPGAQAVITARGRVLAARWQWGGGRVFWSGMNLFGHAQADTTGHEMALLGNQFTWLLGGRPAGPAGSGQHPLQVSWQGSDAASVALAPAAGPTAVMFRQSLMPGWRASLVWPRGSRDLSLLDAGQDFMLVSLDRVPAGARIDFRYQPPLSVPLGQILSAGTLAGLVAWLVVPSPVHALLGRLRALIQTRVRRWFPSNPLRVFRGGGEEDP
jgi:hypothetical protein